MYLKISELQELYEKYTEQKKAKKNRRKSAKPVPGGSREFPNMRGFNPELITEDDNIMLLFIIQFHIHKLQLGPDDAELAFPDAEQWRKRANKHILESLKQQNNQPMQKGYYKKNLFLAYRDFGCTDSFIDYIRSEINFIAADFAAQNIDVQYGCVFSAVTQLSALEKELDLMDTILSLHFTNKFILTSSFNKAYDLKSERKHAQILKGMYNLSKNLSVSNVQQLYEFKDFQTNEAAIR